MKEVITKRFIHANVMRELALNSLFDDGWSGNWAADSSPFYSDGRSIILKAAVPPKIKELLEIRPSEYRHPKNLCKIWENCFSKAHTKLSIRGVQWDQISEMESDLVLLDGLSKPVGLHLYRLMVIKEAVGEAKIYGSFPELAVCFWKGDLPAALLMPVDLSKSHK